MATSQSLIEEKRLNQSYVESERALRAGKLLAKIAPGEEIVVSGIAGRLPMSRDIYQYRDNLINKVDMLDRRDFRWQLKSPYVPRRMGIIDSIEKFDAEFFGIDQEEADMMDATGRMLLEHSFEALLDAGLHPNELRGTKTGIFVSSHFADREMELLHRSCKSPNLGITTCTRSMLAQRVSYVLGFEGPAVSLDTACSSSLYGLEHAYRAIRSGKCENALVAGMNLCLHPSISMQFMKINILSLDGICKCFDERADGYVRAEALPVVLLQKAKHAKRIYTEIIHAKTSCDGFKEQGILYPSNADHKQLYDEIYQECGINPTTVDYLEAHCTGTFAGDLEEMKGIQKGFCENRKSPLYVGSVKSNVGHAELAAGLSSLIKVILNMENNTLLPNINYKYPRKDIEAIDKGEAVVVKETIPWPSNGSGLAGINSFGFGGANGHAILRRFHKQKRSEPANDLPQLICVSGRTETSVSYIFDRLNLDTEFIRLLHEIFRDNILGHKYRGYITLSKTKQCRRSICKYIGAKPTLCFSFGGLSKKWINFDGLAMFPPVSDTLQRVDSQLLSKGIKIKEILTQNGKPKSTLAQILANVVTQIVLVDILTAVELIPNYIYGVSMGELAAAYADGTLTLEETILIAYYIGLYLGDVNSKINGDFENNNSIVEKKETHSGTGFQLSETSMLLKQLKQIIPNPKQRSIKWLTKESPKLISAEYLTDLFSTSTGNENSSVLPQNSIVLEIGSETKLFKNFNALISLEGNDDSLLNTLGRMYQLGYNPKLAKLYPKIEWPVSVGTPMISPLIKWDHSLDHYIPNCSNWMEKIMENYKVTCSVQNPDWSFITGHIIDGINLFPATGYIFLVWEAIASAKGLKIEDVPIVLENIKILRAVNVPKTGDINFSVNVNRTSHRFEVTESGQSVASGNISISEDSCEPSLENIANISRTNRGEELITKNDIYKKFRLSGYGFTGAFRSMKEYDPNCSKGLVEWAGNWIVFLDSVMQTAGVENIMKSLYVPTGIGRIVINPKILTQYMKNHSENPAIPVYGSREARIIRAPGIEIRDLRINPISRRKNTNSPLLETYKFVPFESQLTVEQSLKVIVQILLENMDLRGSTVRVLELTDALNEKEPQLLGPLIHDSLRDQMLIQSDVVVLSDKPLNGENDKEQHTTLHEEKNSCSMVVTSNIITNTHVISALKQNGLILSREDLKFDPSSTEDKLKGFDILCVYETSNEKLVLLRQRAESKIPTIININKGHKDLNWLSGLQSMLKINKNVVVISQNDPSNGILGFINCLRREPGNFNVKCYFILSDAPKFNIEHIFYRKQFNKGLTINVYKEGKWGSYRHLPLSLPENVPCEHAFSNVTTTGDLSSMRWIEGPITSATVLPQSKEKVHIYYSAINFRDVVVSTGRIALPDDFKSGPWQYCTIGNEFVGRTDTGKRVMGFANGGAIANMLDADKDLLFEVPDYWTMEDALSSFQTYCTVIYALVVKGEIKAGQSILIHCGAGATGQTAINIALHYRCEVFVTVSEAKRDFIKQKYPQISENHIGNSRDTSFEEMIFRETKGKGVDIILNSLAEEKLQTSLRCLAPRGQFFEIGKYDLLKDNPLRLKCIERGCSFHGIMLDEFLKEGFKEEGMLKNLVQIGLKEGYVEPLPRTIFKENDVEQALRFMASGKHIGKILIQLREEESENVSTPSKKILNGIPRFYCDWRSCCIILGGLGGFGLELTEWLISRGASNIVLVSKRGVRTGYQALKLRTWKSRGVNVHISTADTTMEEGCISLMQEASNFGEVTSIFNLMLMLKDALFENQNANGFVESLSIKAVATQNLDRVSRLMCPKLQQFVVFSSVSCGKGNAGQTNYGMGNSVMERICEQRKKEGYPALAIQWGVIGDVGVVAETIDIQSKINLSGILPQNMASCLEVLDIFLKQDEPIVSSMIVAKGTIENVTAEGIVETVQMILGIRNLKSISLYTSLSELGMDSITAVMLRQALEKHNLFLSPQDMRQLTFAKLQEIAEQEFIKNEDQNEVDDKTTEMFSVIQGMTNPVEDLNNPIVRIPSRASENADVPTLFLIPGVNGSPKPFSALASNINAHVLCLQYGNCQEDLTIENEAKLLMPHIEQNLSKLTPFVLAGHSYGAVVVIELASLLEKLGYTGSIILLDGTPDMLKQLVKSIFTIAPLDLFRPGYEIYRKANPNYSWDNFLEIREKILTDGLDDSKLHNEVKNIFKTTEGDSYKSQMIGIYCLRGLSALTYQPKINKLRSKLHVFKSYRSETQTTQYENEIQELCENQINVVRFKGNHFTMLRNPEVMNTINNICCEEFRKACSMPK